MNIIRIITRTALVTTAAVALSAGNPIGLLHADGSMEGGGGAQSTGEAEQEQIESSPSASPEAESMESGGGGAGETGTGMETETGGITEPEAGTGGGGGTTGAGTAEGMQTTGTVRMMNPETNEITVQADDGTTKTYTVNPGTPIQQSGQTVPLSALSQGDKVSVTVESDGSTVRSIEVQ